MAKRESAGRPTVPTRDTARIQAANFLRKAEGHLAQALEAAAAGRWDTAVLLSVHAGISAADAACVAEHGVRSLSSTFLVRAGPVRFEEPPVQTARFDV